MSSSASPNRSPDGWRRLLAAVRPDADPHPIDAGALGEYAALLDRDGPRAAAQAHPEVADHLAVGCDACAADLREAIAFAADERSRGDTL